MKVPNTASNRRWELNKCLLSAWTDEGRSAVRKTKYQGHMRDGDRQPGLVVTKTWEGLERRDYLMWN